MPTSSGRRATVPSPSSSSSTSPGSSRRVTISTPSPAPSTSSRRGSISTPSPAASPSSRRGSISTPSPAASPSSRRGSISTVPSGTSPTIARRAATLAATSPGPGSRRRSVSASSVDAAVTPVSRSPSPAVRRSSLKSTPNSTSPTLASSDGAAPSSRSPSPAVRRSSLKKSPSKETVDIVEETSVLSSIRPFVPTTTSTSLSPQQLKASETVERAVAELEMQMPTDSLYGTSSIYRGYNASGTYTVPSLAPPSIPVRSTSPSPVRTPIGPTEVAFGRHHSPPPARPPSPPPQARALPRRDGNPTCENGCGRAASYWCEKCEIEVCGFCDSMIHGKNTALKRHQRVHLVDRLQLCSAHHETMRLFCSECSALVCQHCVTTSTHKFPDGRGHSILNVEEAAGSKRAEIADMAQQLRRVAISAPRTLEHLQRCENNVRQNIAEVAMRLHAAVDEYEQRLCAELRSYMADDQDQISRHIDSTATVRRRLEQDADNADSISSPETPAQMFLLHWRDLRLQLQQDLTLKLGQPEPQVKMNVELTGQVQSGKVMTLEMEIQRVLDALNRCGRPTDVPRNAGHVVGTWLG